MLGRSAENTDCGNCIELHDVNLLGRLLEDPNLDTDNIVENIVAYEATRKTTENKNRGSANSARSNNKGRSGNNNGGGSNNNNRGREETRDQNVCSRCLDPNHDKGSCMWRKMNCTFCGFTGHSTATCGKLKKAMDSGSIAPPPKQTSGKSGTGSKKFKGKGKANMIAGAEEENSSEGEDNGVIHHVSSAKHAPQTMM